MFFTSSLPLSVNAIREGRGFCHCWCFDTLYQNHDYREQRFFFFHWLNSSGKTHRPGMNYEYRIMFLLS